MQSSPFTLTRTAGGQGRSGRSSGKVSRPPLVGPPLASDTSLMCVALQYPYVVAFEPTFVEVHHVETGHLVQIIPGSTISCLFADTPPSRINAPMPPPNRQFMYPPGQPGPFQLPLQHQTSYPQYVPQQPGYRPPVQAMTPRPYAMGPPPVPAMPRFARPQIIFTSDDGHVQFLKFPPPRPPAMHNHRATH